MSGFFRALALIVPTSIALPALAVTPLDAPRVVGAWTVGGAQDASGLFDRCIAERDVGRVTVQFVRDMRGYSAVLWSPEWRLEPEATYPARLVGAPSLDTEISGTVLDQRRIAFKLGEGALMIDRLRASEKRLEVRGASGTIGFSLDRLAAALDEVDRCWKRRAPAAANPFAATATGIPQAATRPSRGRQLLEEQTFLDVEIYGRIYRLESAIVKPVGAVGRLPIALITHGTTTDPEEMPQMRAATLLPQARDLAQRGWLAVAVVRRGYGLSQGPGQNGPLTCSNPRFSTGFDADAAELEAALAVIRSREDSDPERAIAIGVSGGGAAVLALAARRPAGLVAAVNVSGGLNLIRQDGTHCGSDDKLVEAFRELGGRTRVPTLWAYAENDSFFRADLVRRMHEAFTRAGGTAQLRIFEPIGRNGHEIFSTAQGRYHWLPELDGFLRAEKLPTWDAERVRTVMQAGRLADNLSGWVARYLSAPSGKVLAVSSSGKGVRLRFGIDDGSARQSAVSECEETYREPCRVLMEDLQLEPGAETARLAGAPTGN